MDGRAERLRAGLTLAFGHDVGALTLHGDGGGCINHATTLIVGERRVFVKWNDRPLPDQFHAEAAGLAALAAAGTPLRIPRVLAHDDGGPGQSFLALEALSPGPRAADFDVRFGHGLAALHRPRSDAGFGFPIDNYCGATPQHNAFLPRWLDFYRERRLLPQLARARQHGMAAVDSAILGRLVDRLDEWLAEDEPPALIHGDLWSGNLFASDSGPALIDPAVSYAHREAELGMMVLFGGFPARVFEAYHEAAPLRDGFRERLPLYSLYHVLNHFNLFGGGYAEQAVRIARRFVGDTRR